MNIVVERLKSDNTATIGFMWIDKEPTYFTLEDAHQDVKIAGITRIPKGTYDIVLRTEGGMHQKYTKRFSFHKGMLWLLGVPDFKWVYIHTGNTPSDTEGCLLVGTLADIHDDDMAVGASVKAYSTIYQTIVNAIMAGEKVSITIKDEHDRDNQRTAEA